jgi:hypothetical protein
MNVNFRRVMGGALALAVASVIALSGCGKGETHSMEKAGAAADKAIDKAKDATATAAKSVGAAAEKAMDSAAASASQAGAAVGAAAEKAADKTAEAAKDVAASAAKATSTAVAPSTKH